MNAESQSRSRLLLALDRMIESVREDLRKEANPAVFGGLNGELKGLMAARAYAEAEAERANPSETAPTVRYERRPELDKRIARGDDFAGDAWVRWTVPGHTPDDNRCPAIVTETGDKA